MTNLEQKKVVEDLAPPPPPKKIFVWGDLTFSL